MAGVRKQLRELEENREERLRDLGALALEMYRREEFELEVLTANANELGEVEDRIRALDPARGDTQG